MTKHESWVACVVSEPTFKDNIPDIVAGNG